MKIFNDKFNEWLTNEINATLSPTRKRILQEVKSKMEQIIKEEYAKVLAEKKASENA